MFSITVTVQWESDFFARTFSNPHRVYNCQFLSDARSEYDWRPFRCCHGGYWERRDVSRDSKWLLAYRAQLISALKGFQDFDRLLTSVYLFCQIRWSQLLSVSDTSTPSEERINSIILLKHILEKIAPVIESLHGCRSPLLKSIQNVWYSFWHVLLTVVVLRSKNTCRDRTYQGGYKRRCHLDERGVGITTSAMLCRESLISLRVLNSCAERC